MHHYGALSYFRLRDDVGFVLDTITQYTMLHNALFSILVYTSPNRVL